MLVEGYKHKIFTYNTEQKCICQGRNNCGDDSSMFLSGDGHWCDTVIAKHTNLNKNSIPEIKYFRISFLHIVGGKNRIYLSNATLHVHYRFLWVNIYARE